VLGDVAGIRHRWAPVTGSSATVAAVTLSSVRWPSGPTVVITVCPDGSSSAGMSPAVAFSCGSVNRFDQRTRPSASAYAVRSQPLASTNTVSWSR
jgi:hypothetical protein